MDMPSDMDQVLSKCRILCLSESIHSARAVSFPKVGHAHLLSNEFPDKIACSMKFGIMLKWRSFITICKQNPWLCLIWFDMQAIIVLDLRSTKTFLSWNDDVNPLARGSCKRIPDLYKSTDRHKVEIWTELLRLKRLRSVLLRSFALQELFHLHQKPSIGRQ